MAGDKLVVPELEPKERMVHGEAFNYVRSIYRCNKLVDFRNQIKAGLSPGVASNYSEMHMFRSATDKIVTFDYRRERPGIDDIGRRSNQTFTGYREELVISEISIPDDCSWLSPVTILSATYRDSHVAPIHERYIFGGTLEREIGRESGMYEESNSSYPNVYAAAIVRGIHGYLSGNTPSA